MNPVTTAAAESRRMIQLDFLRGIAIMLVLFHHNLYRGPAMGWLRPVTDPLYFFGWSGVSLFFVLSGFLIGGLLFAEIHKTGQVNVKRFLVRRAFKIWPPYFIFIAYCFVRLLHRHETMGGAFHLLWPNLLQIQNYIATPPAHTWSLAVEEHFYLGLALLLYLLMRDAAPCQKLDVIPWVALGLMALCLLFRVINLAWPFNMQSDVFATHIRIDALFLGVCISYFHHFRPGLFARVASHRLWLVIFGVAANLPMFFLTYRTPFVSTVGHTLMALGFGSLLIAVIPARGDAGPVSPFWSCLAVRLLAWIGVYSYSIYLWHQDLVEQPLMYWLDPKWTFLPLAWHGTVFLALYLSGAVIVGAIMARLIEIPAVSLRDRFFPAVNRREAAQSPIYPESTMEPASLSAS